MEITHKRYSIISGEPVIDQCCLSMKTNEKPCFLSPEKEYTFPGVVFASPFCKKLQIIFTEKLRMLFFENRRPPMQARSCDHSGIHLLQMRPIIPEAQHCHIVILLRTARKQVYGIINLMDQFFRSCVSILIQYVR